MQIYDMMRVEKLRTLPFRAASNIVPGVIVYIIYTQVQGEEGLYNLQYSRAHAGAVELYYHCVHMICKPRAFVSYSCVPQGARNACTC